MTHPLSDRLETALIDLAIDSWRFSRLFARAVDRLDTMESGRYLGQLKYFDEKLSEHLGATGLRIVDLEGQSFDTGTAAVALNISDFDATDTLLVDHMVEPIIVGPEGLKRQGTVILRKADT